MTQHHISNTTTTHITHHTSHITQQHTSHITHITHHTTTTHTNNTHHTTHITYQPPHNNNTHQQRQHQQLTTTTQHNTTTTLNRDNTHSWVRISYGSNRFVMNLNNNETKIPEVQLEEYALKLDAKDFCMPIKGKNRTTEKRTCRLFTKNSFYWEADLD